MVTFLRKKKKMGGGGGDNNAFMLNDCKYLYNMYRRFGMLYLVVLLICITITIIIRFGLTK